MKKLHFDTPYDYDADGKPGVLAPVKIDYTTASGRGTITMNMAQVFPAAAHNLKVIIDTLWMSPDTYETAGTICDYIKKVIEDLQALRWEEAYTADDKKYNAKITGYIKRYISNLDKLAQAFGFESVTDESAQAQKMKKCTVVCSEAKNGASYAAEYSGKEFEKNGFTFQVCQKTKNGPRFVIVPGTGLSIATYCGTEKEAPEQIGAREMQALEKMFSKNPQSFENLCEKLRALCDAAEIDAPMLPDCYKAPAEPETETALVYDLGGEDRAEIIEAQPGKWHIEFTSTNKDGSRYVTACARDYDSAEQARHILTTKLRPGAKPINPTPEPKAKKPEPDRAGAQATKETKHRPPYWIITRPAQVWKPCTMTKTAESGIIYGDHMHRPQPDKIAVLRLSKSNGHINLYRTSKKPVTGEIQNYKGILQAPAIWHNAPPGNGAKHENGVYFRMCPIRENGNIQMLRGVTFQNSA